ncbi:hypothetical protein Tco_0474174 [Tanacetum coccineum]
MSNKKRSSKRKPKLANKFNDHVMSTLSQKRYDATRNVDLEEIRVDKDHMVEEIGVINKEMDEGVFGCADKVHHECVESSVSMRKNVVVQIGEFNKEMDKRVFGCAKKVNNDCDESSVNMNKNVEGMW